MSDNPTEKQSGTHISGVSNSVVTTGDVGGSIQNIHIGRSSEEQSELQVLVKQLNTMLQNVPPEKRENAEAVRLQAEALLKQANTDTPNKPLLKITADGLKQAAEDIADVADNVMSVVSKIIAIVLGSVA